MTSIFIGSPRPPCSRASSRRGLEPLELAEELRAAGGLADKSRHLEIEQGAELRLAPPERRRERLLPARQPEPLEGGHGRSRDQHEARLAARARLAEIGRASCRERV